MLCLYDFKIAINLIDFFEDFFECFFLLNSSFVNESFFEYFFLLNSSFK